MRNGLWIYMVIAGVITIYQGARGFAFQYWRNELQLQIRPYTDPPLRKVWLLCISDGIFHGASCAAGFVALFVLHALWRRIDFANMTAGSGAVVIFLALFGLFGVTGQLPPLIQGGKLSPFGKAP